MLKGTPGIKVSVESLTVSVYINIIIRETKDSLWNQSLPLTIVSIRVKMYDDVSVI